jgi:hypothetical protein
VNHENKTIRIYGENMVMPSAQQCSVCGQAFLGSDAREIPSICPDCKYRDTKQMLGPGRINWKDLVDFGLAPEGLSRECPNCGVWAYYTELNGKPKGITCAAVECPCCKKEFEIFKGIKSLT